jgi:MFS family permease
MRDLRHSLSIGDSYRSDVPTGAQAVNGWVRSIFAVVLGNTLEFYDFTIYVAFAPILARVFFPMRDPMTGLLLLVSTFGIGFVIRHLGGILLGAYSDRYGRKPAMTLTIGLMALASGIIGLLPTYRQIGTAAPLLLVRGREDFFASFRSASACSAAQPRSSSPG